MCFCVLIVFTYFLNVMGFEPEFADWQLCLLTTEPSTVFQTFTFSLLHSMDDPNIQNSVPLPPFRTRSATALQWLPRRDGGRDTLSYLDKRVKPSGLEDLSRVHGVSVYSCPVYLKRSPGWRKTPASFSNSLAGAIVVLKALFMAFQPVAEARLAATKIDEFPLRRRGSTELGIEPRTLRCLDVHFKAITPLGHAFMVKYSLDP
eukprot:Selendium_serpulae@DN5835_c0_g1_i8.p1